MMGQIVWIGILVVVWIVIFANFTDIVRHDAYGLFVFPVFITVPTILWYARHAIGRKMREGSAKTSINQVSASNKTQWGETNRKNREERAVQLHTLRDAVP